MSRVTKKKAIVASLLGWMLISSAACTPDDDTVSSLVDLFASTTGSFVEIVVKSTVNGLLTAGQFAIDLGAPISEQEH